MTVINFIIFIRKAPRITGTRSVAARVAENADQLAKG
jgi:hypothetical protein